MEEQDILWEGTPSHYTKLVYYIIYTPLILIGVGIILILLTYFQNRNDRYTITTRKIIHRRGIFDKKTDELQLFRVKDIKLDEPLLNRIFGLSKLILITSDKSSRYITIPGLKNGLDLQKKLSVSIEESRKERGVREVDFE